MPKTHYEVLQDQAPNCESRWKEFEVYEIPKEPLDDVFTAVELDDIATAANMVMHAHVYPFLTVDGPALIRWLKTRISGAIQRAFAAGGFRFVYRFGSIVVYTHSASGDIFIAARVDRAGESQSVVIDGRIPKPITDAD